MCELAIDLAALAEYLRESGHYIRPLNIPTLEPGFDVRSTTVRISVLRVGGDWRLQIWYRRSHNRNDQSNASYSASSNETRGPAHYIDPAIPDAIERVEEIIKCHIPTT